MRCLVLLERIRVEVACIAGRRKYAPTRALSRWVKAARVAPKGALSNSHRALALALTLLALGRTIGEVLSPALHHSGP